MNLLINFALAPFFIGVSGTAFKEELRQRDNYNFVENLAQEVQQLCHKHDKSLNDISSCALVVGPGVYTGLRVSVTSIKALAGELGFNLFPLSTMGCLMSPFRHQEGVYLSVIPGRKSEVVTQLLSCKEGQVKPLSDLVTWSFEQLNRFMDQNKDVAIVMADHESLAAILESDKSLIKSALSADVLDNCLSSPEAFFDLSLDSDKVHPVYAYSPVVT